MSMCVCERESERSENGTLGLGVGRGVALAATIRGEATELQRTVLYFRAHTAFWAPLWPREGLARPEAAGGHRTPRPCPFIHGMEDPTLHAAVKIE
eukprot:6232444-Prymnesium_polylepis.2